MRPHHYPSDITDAQWALIEPHIPPVHPGGRPRKTDVRDVLDAILHPPHRLPVALLPRQPRSAQILTADSVQQQPIAAPEGSEINHGIHRNTRKRESESTSPFRVLPGGNSRP